jgi:hypothetical protein
MKSPLTLLAGRTAFERIKAEGLSASLFETVVGASGGAKMLALTHLDRYIFGEFFSDTHHRVELVGSSIGTWRHVAAAAPDPVSALAALHERYLNQWWDEDDKRTATEIVDELCSWVIDGFCTSDVAEHICETSRFRTHIVTARGRGLNSRPAGPLLGIGMALSAAENFINRGLLASGFQRVVFSSGESLAFNFQDFDTTHVPLTPTILKSALLASGSIPFLMSGQKDIADAPKGHLWDGGIVDYHFDFANFCGNGLVLYPHFTNEFIKGWFDKPLPWRRNTAGLLNQVLVLAPSAEYVQQLPYGEIPDRKDFKRLARPERLRYWKTAMAASQELGDAFAKVVNADEPARFLTCLD